MVGRPFVGAGYGSVGPSGPRMPPPAPAPRTGDVVLGRKSYCAGLAVFSIFRASNPSSDEVATMPVAEPW